MKGLACFILVLWLVPAGAQELIAHRSVEIHHLTRNEARLYLMMRLRHWPNGVPVKVFVLPDDDALHQRFVNTVLGLYPYQLRQVWDRLLFSGTGLVPVTLSSQQEMLERVAVTPGALGYTALDVSSPDILTIEVH